MNISKNTASYGWRILFSFSGIISQSLTEFMVETASKQFLDSGFDKMLIKNMFLISIEQLQNVMSYSKQKSINSGNKYTSPGVLVVGFEEEKQKYYVTSSNEIEEEDKLKITTKIDFINSIRFSRTKKIFKEKLKSAEDTHERAVLGLLKWQRNQVKNLNTILKI